jgi:hypothetical protein
MHKKHFIRLFFLSVDTGSCSPTTNAARQPLDSDSLPLTPFCVDSAGTYSTICAATICNRHAPAHVHDAGMMRLDPPKIEEK